MKRLCNSTCTTACLLATACATAAAGTLVDTTATSWEPAGWGGGGFYYSATFHPTRDGVIYMGGDVGGIYKTEDHGRHWRMINDGLASYGVFSLAVDHASPDTVYAATTAGLCKSTDAGEHWRLLPQTGPKALHITGEKKQSVRCVAVDPTDSKIVYAGSPAGKIYKSADGGRTWTSVYQLTSAEAAAPPGVLRVQFGGVNEAYHGGIWTPLPAPSGVKADDLRAFGFSFKSNGIAPKTALVSLTTSDGARYASKNLHALFEKTAWQDVTLAAADFTLDSSQTGNKTAKGRVPPKQPDWQKVDRVDFCCVNMDNAHPSVGLVGAFYFVTKNAAAKLIAKDFAKNKACLSYGNVSTAAPKSGAVFSVAVAGKNPAMVLGATETAGIVLSEDGGTTWQELPTPKKASSVAVAATDPNILFGAFGAEGVWKSTDKGKTWNKSSEGIKSPVLEVAVSPANVQDVCAVASAGWDGHFYASQDGGKTWKESSKLASDHDANPTEGDGMSAPTNLCINPSNPHELFISANWRPCISSNSGRTWSESDRGADITCFTDIRFQGGHVYASAMDEGSFVSTDNGRHWRQMWPRKYDPQFSGHNWQMSIGNNHGKDRIISSCSPWDANLPNYVAVSEDGGATFKVAKSGLPDYRPTANTMWGMSYPRGLAVDPSNPTTVYLGMDGDASEGKCGGGVFKSENGGYAWKQLARQPGCRRCFYGLSIDPTDSKRLYWGACGSGGGVWRSEDGGDSWKHVFPNSAWVFNVMAAPNGDVYCGETNVWRSTDHGATWKQLTHFTDGATTVGLETDPRDPKTLWISRTVWSDDAVGGVYKTSDGGVTWTDITGNLGYRKPICLRFDPATSALWAAGVGVFRTQQ